MRQGAKRFRHIQVLAGQRQVGLAGVALATVFAGRTATGAKAADRLVNTAKR